MRLPFAKYSGCGNDFIIVDNRESIFPSDRHNIIRRFCDRRTGIGADGVILLETSDQADYKMRIYNPDAGEAEMCGNGIRCLLRFIQTIDCQVDKCKIETLAGPIRLASNLQGVSAEMGNPTNIRWNLQVKVDSTIYTVHHLNTGVPHLVLFVSDLDAVDIENLGRALRYHLDFQPQGVNVNFARIEKDKIHYRTYERGVEGETLACGTGAVAVAIAAAHSTNIQSPIKIRTKSGEILDISFTCRDDLVTDVIMTGPATLVFQGIIELN